MPEIPDSVKQEAARAAMAGRNIIDQNKLQGKDVTGEQPQPFEYGQRNPDLNRHATPAPTATPSPTDPPKNDPDRG
jgi:hypothetical protein